MDFLTPEPNVFTIYTKSGCPNCLKVKNLLKENKLIFTIIDCDEYIIEDKETFLSFIASLSNREVNVFPIVFYDGKFVGGYNETVGFVDELLLAFDANF